jgi:hypothetical protein
MSAQRYVMQISRLASRSALTALQNQPFTAGDETSGLVFQGSWRRTWRRLDRPFSPLLTSLPIFASPPCPAARYSHPLAVSHLVLLFFRLPVPPRVEFGPFAVSEKLASAIPYALKSSHLTANYDHSRPQLSKCSAPAHHTTLCRPALTVAATS